MIKAGLDVGSLGVLVAWWVDKAPAIATTLTVFWVGFCLVEGMYRFYKWMTK